MQQRLRGWRNMEREDCPQTRKGLPEVQEEWEERAVSQISRDPDPHLLALQPRRRPDPKRKCCARFTPWTQQRFSEPGHIQEVTVSQQLKGP